MMKGREWLKRYWVFLSLLAINVLIGILWPQIGRQSWTLTKSNLVEMISVIPPIFILLGLLDIWVDRATGSFSAAASADIGSANNDAVSSNNTPHAQFFLCLFICAVFPLLIFYSILYTILQHLQILFYIFVNFLLHPKIRAYPSSPQKMPHNLQESVLISEDTKLIQADCAAAFT